MGYFFSQILQVKQAIQREQGHAVDQQKLIFAGKILEDNQDLTSCGVKETDFLVLMVRKPKSVSVFSNEAFFLKK